MLASSLTASSQLCREPPGSSRRTAWFIGGTAANPHRELPPARSFDSVKRYEDYISRLRKIPRAFLQTEEVLRAGVNDRLVPVRFIAEKIPSQAQGVIASNPLMIMLRHILIAEATPIWSLISFAFMPIS